MLAGDRHVMVAYGLDYADVPPTRGVLKGDAESLLEVDVHVNQGKRLCLDGEFFKVVRTPRGRTDPFNNLANPTRTQRFEIQYQMEQQQQ
ncbi:hypothetical protein PsB1_2144 [Candidatus Phycosocius spiralis]|uniref:Uncharacterized protein n=1 Tax=Candidatus Phycosocius spiralis TaxID=2815099 RepID=A0ABQ4PYE0_9PROT|nr:hypothetical protein PsB1_2144 [Candidatus Phycosocius spiralis]